MRIRAEGVEAIIYGPFMEEHFFLFQAVTDLEQFKREADHYR